MIYNKAWKLESGSRPLHYCKFIITAYYCHSYIVNIYFFDNKTIYSCNFDYTGEIYSCMTILDFIIWCWIKLDKLFLNIFSTVSDIN